MAPRIRVLAAALIVLAGCAPTASATPATSPSTAPTPTAVIGAAACTADQLVLAAGEVEGAMGTTYIEVQVVRQGGEPCEIRRWPDARIVDASGTQMVATQPSTRLADVVDLSERFSFNLGWSSWCGDMPVRPYLLEVGLISGEISKLQLPDSYQPSGCMGAESALTFEPAT